MTDDEKDDRVLDRVRVMKKALTDAGWAPETAFELAGEIVPTLAELSDAAASAFIKMLASSPTDEKITQAKANVERRRLLKQADEIKKRGDGGSA